MNFIYVQILVTSDRKLVNFSIIATFLNRFRRVAFLVHSTPSDLRSGSSIYHCTMWHIPLRCKWYITFHYRWYIPIRFVWFFYSATGGSDSPLYPEIADKVPYRSDYSCNSLSVASTILPEHYILVNMI